VKESENPHFGSRYSSLAACHNACEPALAANSLAVIQTTHWADGVLMLVTTLMHTSGEQLESAYPILADYNAPQKIGAALTYGRRYSYMAAVGIAPEDDDGESAMGRGQAPTASNGNGHVFTNGHTTNGQAGPSTNGKANGQAGDRRPPAAEGPPPGKALYRWAQDEGNKHGADLVQYLIRWGRDTKVPGRIVEWPQEVTERAYGACEAVLEQLAGSGHEGT
jgi:hypothetical protein